MGRQWAKISTLKFQKGLHFGTWTILGGGGGGLTVTSFYFICGYKAPGIWKSIFDYYNILSPSLFLMLFN